MESLYYCFSVRPWHRNVARALRKEPKYYLWDWSLIDEASARAENLVAAALLKAVHLWTDHGFGDFARFLEAVSFSHGAQLNVSNVARECGVARKTVEGYVSVLRDLLIAHLVPVFNKRSKRKLATHAKLYLFDTGLFRQLRPRGPLDRPEQIGGAALEGLVYQHLVAWIDRYLDPSHALHFWRTRSGTEVDFVICGSRLFVAIEVKNSATVRPADLRGLKALLSDYPQCRGFLLYRGADTFVRDGITVLPVERSLSDPLVFGFEV
ncbi:ATP-binding protein [Planctomycetota bacterium]